MNGTLPLFQENAVQLSGKQEPGERAPAPQRARRLPAAEAERHLRAARRLSRAMRRYPDRSPEQTRAGRAICHHLQALLAESDS